MQLNSQEPPHTPDATYVHSRGVRLHVDLQGPRNSPLVLLVHGFGGGSFEWRDVMEGLAQSHLRVAAVDLRGYGRSDKTPRGYDLTTAASDMAGVIRGLGYTEATVVGHGFGGMVAWTLAAHSPERVTQLITLSSSHPIERWRFALTHPTAQWRLAQRTLFSQLPRLPEKRLVENDAALAEKIFRHATAPGFRDTDAYRVQAAQRRQAMQIDKVAHLSCEYQRWFVRSRFRPEGLVFERTFPKRVAVALLAIEGSMDPHYDPKLTERSAHHAEGSRVELLYGVGHYPHIEDPQAVVELLLGTLPPAQQANLA